MDSHVLQLQLRMLNSAGRKLFEEGAVLVTLTHAPYAEIPMQEKGAFSNVARVLREKGESEVEVCHGFAELKKVPGLWFEHAWIVDKRTRQHRDVTTDTFARAYGFKVGSTGDVYAARPLFMFAHKDAVVTACIEK